MSATATRRHGRAESSPPQARRRLRELADSPWGDRGARLGLAARAVVFLLLAYLLLDIATGALDPTARHQPAGGRGVAQSLAERPGGRPVLVVLAAGLLLYAMFSLLDAALHHNHESPAAKRWGDRLLSLWGCLLYAAFAAYCVHTVGSPAQGSAGRSDRRSSQWSARVLRWPLGEVWLFLLGVVLFVIAGFLVRRAVRRTFAGRLRRERMSRRAWRLALLLGTVGGLGRAALFGLVGWFVCSAAVENDPRKGQGVDGSVRLLAHGTGGSVLLGVLAAALVCFGSYLLIEARFRKV